MALGVALPPMVFRATVVDVVDGDTLHLDLDLGLRRLGFNLWLHDTATRLAGCNAREHDEPGGPEAGANLAALLPAGALVAADVRGRDEYGRLLAYLSLADGTDVTGLLIDTHWAAPWNGRGRKPVPPWPRPEDITP